MPLDQENEQDSHELQSKRRQYAQLVMKNATRDQLEPLEKEIERLEAGFMCCTTRSKVHQDLRLGETMGKSSKVCCALCGVQVAAGRPATLLRAQTRLQRVKLCHTSKAGDILASSPN